MRGRLYCTPAYQSNELTKSFILFAKPGVIDRGDFKAINYLKIYGANLFGASVNGSNISKK